MLCFENGEFHQAVLFTEWVGGSAALNADVGLSLRIYNKRFLWQTRPGFKWPWKTSDSGHRFFMVAWL